MPFSVAAVPRVKVEEEEEEEVEEEEEEEEEEEDEEEEKEEEEEEEELKPQMHLTETSLPSPPTEDLLRSLFPQEPYVS